MNPPDFMALAHRFNQPGIQALALMGSYARNAAGRFSDIDLVRYTRTEEAELPGSGSHLIDGRLVVVSQVTPKQVEESFMQPEIAVEAIAGLRQAQPLLDREGIFAAIQQRAWAFRWDETMQAKANRWASRQMVGWIEEVHKGLEGLRSNDIGRLLHARFGCSWGLTRVMCVQRGVLLSGDNALYHQVIAAVGPDTDWARLCQTAFGIEQSGQRLSLREEVIAGLRLYSLTAQMLEDILEEGDASLVMETAALINQTLEGEFTNDANL
jgi:predicted nucleotidyltransferase